MRLLNITATPHPCGNRIDVHWSLPANSPFARVRVVRRTRSHPTTPNPAAPEEGVIIPEVPTQNYVIDKVGVHGETVYYYSLYPYNTTNANGTIVLNDPNQVDRRNRIHVSATSPFNSAGQMAELLPAIYHRYDTILPKSQPNLTCVDSKHGQLRRFLALPGSQLDQMISLARAMLDFYDLERVDGRLLPLLAQWIGWKTDHSLELAAQRNEIRNALALYETIGILPVVESTVKRITRWPNRSKEFVHNVLLSNRAPRLNLWARLLDSANAQPPTEPLSLNFAYEGRPTAVRDAAETLWLFYHTLKHGQWSLWCKTYTDTLQWSASRPLIEPGGAGIHLKGPSAAKQGNQLWLFWERYDDTTQHWRIDFRTQNSGVWSETSTLAVIFDSEVEQRMPTTVVDNAGGLWLFWLERQDQKSPWQLKYNRHNGTTWQLAPAAVFPLDVANASQVEGDLFALFEPTTPAIWLFWAWQKPTTTLGAAQTRWNIAYQVHKGLNPSQPQWSTGRTLSQTTPVNQHQREPAALMRADGKIDLFWSSNRSGSWSVWRGKLDVATQVLSEVVSVVDDAYAKRNPLPLAWSAGGLLLVYRSNQSLGYDNPVYGAAASVDFRYAGATTFDTRNLALRSLRGQFGDFQTYTFDTGEAGKRTNRDWYARDTIGVFFNPGADDQNVLSDKLARLGQVLGEFMPITERAVFVQE